MAGRRPPGVEGRGRGLSPGRYEGRRSGPADRPRHQDHQGRDGRRGVQEGHRRCQRPRHTHRQAQAVGYGVGFAALPRAVFAAAHSADETGLRERAGEEVVRLGEEARAAQGDPTAIERALDAYAAAGTVLDRARGIPDLAGVFALVAEGHAALSGTRPALPLCFFHPLHGPAARRVAWRPLGRREQLRVAACETCIRAIRTHSAPEVLLDRHDGRPVPYFEVPAANSLWAATGYGSLLGDDSLAARVQRGDFTRTVT